MTLTTRPSTEASRLTPLPAASVDGIEIHASSSGSGPRTVILVHGWTCDETTWESQIPALAKDYRVLTIDLPGHGKSGAPKDGNLSMDLFARAVESVRLDSQAKRVVLIGHSMGTPVIVHYARLYPKNVAAMVFADGLVTIPPSWPFARLLGLTLALSAVRRATIRSMFSAATTPEMRERILRMMMSAPTATAVGAMKATFDRTNWKGDVFTQPVLALYADRSPYAKRDAMTRRFPNMEFVEIAGTGHFLMLEKPDEFNRLLLEFLARQTF
jgi:pimeloyl-ACP methyl ester carboxylesterase